MNVPRIKGSHNAIKSGMLAADAAFAALKGGAAGHDELTGYGAGYRASWIYRDLYKVRNVKPGLSKFGTVLGTAHGGLHMWLNSLGLGILVPWTLKHGKPDNETLKPKEQCRPIEYPKPDGTLTFDRLSSVFISNTNHEEDQPSHLRLRDAATPIAVNLARYDAPEQRYCPAGVYEIVRDDDGTHPRLQINAQNCVHCKTCDIKDPLQNINWVVPEGGGGPNYPNM
jgi:electron-transferring-flavoprotein dehydrogenase